MSPIDNKLRMASQFEDDKKYLHALQIYEPLVNDEQYTKIASLRLSNIYEKLNNAKKAIELLQNYCDAKPEDYSVKKYFAHFLLRHKKYESCLNLLSSIPADENTEVYFLKGYANYHLGDFEISKINFTLFIENEKKSELLFEAHHYLAKIFLNIGELDNAEKSVADSEKLFSQNPDLKLTQAIIYYYKEMYLHAYEKIRRALSLKEGEPNYIKWAGKILIKIEDYEKAENYLRSYITVSEPDSELLSLLGLACLNTNKMNDAKTYFLKALEIDPDNEVAMKGKLKCSSDL